jgi:para-nitrobenzyl esterase
MKEQLKQKVNKENLNHKAKLFTNCLVIFTLLTAALYLTAAAANAEVFQTTITTKYGKIKGYEDKANTLAWKGIPFAKAPMGELRWRAPKDPDSWDDVLETTEFGDQCTQFAAGGKVVGSEDCLYMNIWRPKTEETGLPVYFWIHGGGNSILTASTDRYNGVKIVTRTNMVVVTMNYRLGPMGWFTHPALRKGESALDDSGNYATLDMIKAMQWVRDNIEAFGGDPNNVTIAGVSAGAVDVFSLLISPMAKGLFHRAIAESGGTRANPVPAGDAHANGVIGRLLVNDGTVADQGAARLHLGKMSEDDIEKYLRSKTAVEILKGHEFSFAPMIKFPYCFTDGKVIHNGGFDALDDPAKYNQVPIIMGTNKEEMKLFMGLGSQYDKMDAETYQQQAIKASQAWRARGVDNPAKKLRTHASQPNVYAYQFDYGAYNPKGYNAWPTDLKGVNWALKFGASHGLEVSFFWGNTFMGYAVNSTVHYML